MAAADVASNFPVQVEDGIVDVDVQQVAHVQVATVKVGLAGLIEMVDNLMVVAAKKIYLDINHGGDEFSYVV